MTGPWHLLNSCFLKVGADVLPQSVFGVPETYKQNGSYECLLFGLADCHPSIDWIDYRSPRLVPFAELGVTEVE